MSNLTADVDPSERKESSEGLAGSSVNYVSNRQNLPYDEVADRKFRVFTLRANQRIYNEIVARRNMDRQYIEALEAILLLNRINIPDRDSIVTARNPDQRHLEAIDGSSEALANLLAKIKDLHQIYHVQICFKDLGYWTNSTKPYIPTVGSTMTNIFIGHGPKHRVDILKGLTGAQPASTGYRVIITLTLY